LKIDIKNKYSAGDEFNYFISSDIHLGNNTFDHEALKKDFDFAVKHNARIFIFGDILDMIVPSDMKRYNAGNDPFHSSAYFNDMIDYAVKILKPYVNNICLISRGNHEVEFQKRHHIDPLSILWRELNTVRSKEQDPILLGNYLGFINLQYEHTAGGKTASQLIYYDHGKGGASEITKGTIGINRMMSRAVADVYLTGHSHNKLVLPGESIFDISNNGKVYDRKRVGIITGSYLKNVKPTDGDKYIIDYGYERMRGNQSTGGVMIKHTLTGYGQIQMSINIEV